MMTMVERRLSNIAMAAHCAGVVVWTPDIDGGILRAHGNPSGPLPIDPVMGRFNRTRVWRTNITPLFPEKDSLGHHFHAGRPSRHGMM